MLPCRHLHLDRMVLHSWAKYQPIRPTRMNKSRTDGRCCASTIQTTRNCPLHPPATPSAALPPSSTALFAVFSRRALRRAAERGRAPFGLSTAGGRRRSVAEVPSAAVPPRPARSDFGSDFGQTHEDGLGKQEGRTQAQETPFSSDDATYSSTYIGVQWGGFLL